MQRVVDFLKTIQFIKSQDENPSFSAFGLTSVYQTTLPLQANPVRIEELFPHQFLIMLHLWVY